MLYDGEGGDDPIDIGRYRAYYIDAEGAPLGLAAGSE